MMLFLVQGYRGVQFSLLGSRKSSLLGWGILDNFLLTSSYDGAFLGQWISGCSIFGPEMAEQAYTPSLSLCHETFKIEIETNPLAYRLTLWVKLN